MIYLVSLAVALLGLDVLLTTRRISKLTSRLEKLEAVVSDGRPGLLLPAPEKAPVVTVVSPAPPQAKPLRYHKGVARPACGVDKCSGLASPECPALSCARCCARYCPYHPPRR